MTTAGVQNDTITAVPGIEVGHYTDLSAATGCTVVLCRGGAVGGVAVRGGAPGTRETDLLRPGSLVREIHGVVLSGGSAFGLEAATGAVAYLEERGVGLSFGPAVLPIVPAAIVFDLGLVRGDVRPGLREGYLACRSATSAPVEEGSVGAGTGATVAKLMGMERAVKGGVGSAAMELEGGLTVGALVVVNALGGVTDPDTGRLVAGPRSGDDAAMLDSVGVLLARGPGGGSPAGANTTIGVVATNASLTREEANRMASVAHDGLALAVRPAHTMRDGDTIFALATGTLGLRTDLDRLAAAAVVCVGRAIVRAVVKAKGVGPVPGVSELRG